MSTKSFFLILVLIFGFAITAAAAPSVIFQKTLLPDTNSQEDLGTSTNPWRDLFVGEICLAGDCKTAWPAGGGGSGVFPFTATTNYAQVVYATSTPSLWFQSGFFASSTSHLVNASSTQQTLTDLWFRTLTSGGLGVDANGKVYKAATTTYNSPLSYSGGAVTLSTSGTWSGNVGTATALASNGSNCSAGSAPLGVDASGAVENCFVVATFGYPFTYATTYSTLSAATSTVPIWAQSALYASSTVAFGIGGNSAFFWDSTNAEVGIGTTSPWGMFSINPNGVSGSAFVVGSSTVTNFVITNGGFTGIGTTSPWSAFTIDRLAGFATSSITVTEYRPATSTAMTIDARDSNSILVRIGVSATTLTLTGFVAGKQLVVNVCNPNATAGAVTWASSPAGLIRWPGGTTPTQTTTANRCDVWSFRATNGTSTMIITGALTAY